MASELEQARAEVRARQRAANAKVSRLKRTKGVDIGGTEFDIRRDMSKVKRYNLTQLNAYLKHLAKFTERSTSFVAGAEGQALPAGKWREYKALEASFNAKGDEAYSQIADTFIPISGMTIAQRDSTLMPNSTVRAAGDVVNRPYSQINQKASAVNGAKALDKLISDMRKRNSPDYLRGKLTESRKQLKQMLKTIGAPELMKKVDELTDNQFDSLWNYAGFANSVSLKYESVKDRNVKSGDSNTHVINELIDWAFTVPTDSKTKTKTKTGNKKKK